MKSKTLRLATVVGVAAIITVGFFTTWGVGTLSAPGIAELSLLCPLGALTTMLATKMMIPRAVISLVIMVLAIIVFARAFCAWICPVPLVSKMRNLFARKPASKVSSRKVDNTGRAKDIAFTEATSEGDTSDSSLSKNSSARASLSDIPVSGVSVPVVALSASEAEELASPCAKGCSSCASKRGSVPDARHFVLGGSLLTAAIFGFPVFCLVCPIGLTFATILLVVRLFTAGDVTIALIVVPLFLAAEVIFFRKWCSKICPLSAFMSLIGKANRTFVPTINDAVCLETSKKVTCGACGKSCPEGIDPRHPQLSSAAWSECSKCRECVDACPVNAITMPLLPKKIKRSKSDTLTKR